MAKKRKAKKLELSGESQDSLAHNPFSALGNLSANLPEQDRGNEAALETERKSHEEKAATSDFSFPQKLTLRREVKGRGGKTVTRLQGVLRQEAGALCKALKRALGCGAKIEGDEILLLGSVVDRAADWLEAHGAQSVTRGN